MDRSVVKLVLFLTVFGQLPGSESVSVPPIFLYDDFDRCEAQSSVYCYGRTVLRLDQYPAGFVVPQTESMDRIVYQHRVHHLELGICLRECERELEGVANRDQLYQPQIPVNFTFLIPNELFPTMKDDKRRYETLVNVCVNRRLRARYNITGYTALEYCRPEAAKQKARPFDALELLFLAILGTLLGTLILSSILDFNRVDRDNVIVSAFSIRRNWDRLHERPSSQLHRDLRYIDGLRVIINHLVIVLHSFLIASAAPSRNYDELEEMMSFAPLLIYISSNAFLVQVFFTIGGYLLSVNVLRDSEKTPINVRYAGNKVLNRLLRLVPVYAFFLLFSVSVNKRFDVNLSGYRLFTAENAICRQNWWANLFFVNNFLWPEELCLMHTWYLAADLQLFLMAMGLLLVIYRWPKSVGVVFLGGVIASFVIPGYVLHVHKLHPVLPAKLSETKFLTMYDPWLRRIYLPSYTNTGSYLFGVIAGYVYHGTKTNRIQLQNSLLFKAVDKCVTPVLIGVIMSTYLWYAIDIPKPNIWVTLYSSLYRNIIGIFVAVCFMRCIITPRGDIRKFLSNRFLTTLGKLTYSAYVLHDVVMRFILLNESYNTLISAPTFFMYVYIVTALAFIGGLVVFLVIEQPMIQLLKPYVNQICPYHRMPKLWQMDDYDECLQSPGPDEPPGVYCSSTVVLKPDNRSELWKLIEEFSSDYKRNYNHRVLKRFVCIRKCQKAVERLSPSERKALTVEKFPIDFTYKFDDGVLESAASYQEVYADLVEICINKELNETYGLVAHTEILSCDKSTDEISLDALDMSFLIILSVLVCCVILSSWYDSSINYKLNSEHYKQSLESKRKMVWVSFSIQRNWYRLTSRSRDETHQKLRFFQAFRFLTMSLVIFGHAALLLALSPTTHSEKLEQLMHSVGSMILTNGVQITQTFLAMSGTLLAIQVLSFAEKRKGRISFLYVPVAILYRYVRLTPVYAFVILLHATWLLKLQTGPMWRWGAETEQTFCRRNWWTNLLYVNNYVHADEPCVQQGWYLGAEFQVFIIALIVLITIVKFPRAKIFILSLVLAAAYIVPAFFIYHQKLPGTFVLTLEAQRYILWYDKLYLQAYIPTHINFGNYMLGVLTGVIYNELRQRSINLAESKAFRAVWYATFLIVPLSMLPSYVFYVNDFETPSVWMAIYFPIMKNLYGIGIGIVIVGSIYGVNGVLKRILNYPFFEPLGRLAYGAYLIHPFVMRYMFISGRGPVYYSDTLTLSLVFGAIVMSCLLSLALCLLLELPTSALQNQLFGSFTGKKPNQIDAESATKGSPTPIIPDFEAKKSDP
uniref:Acyltransferase 3 domain-containing protein n=1 Tax=Anopheles stephensi TaxID=30069 RepID=A0A182YEG2_ANOST